MAEKSIGLIELFSIAAGFLVADTMLKAGNVRLILSRSICSGKYMVLIGGEAAVAAGAEAANGCLIDQFVIANVHPDVIAEAGVLVSAIVISRPHPDVYREVI
jgi:microcompartment protein CcmL/EutN